MRQQLLDILKKDDGAVTVDWVVLCAGIVVLAVTLYTSLETGALGLATLIQSFLATYLA
ncbi:MAG: hypothetical protein ABJ364_08505 [Lentilitoribacter sp.]